LPLSLLSSQRRLLRYSARAVDDHSILRCASYLRQPRLVNNPGEFLGSGFKFWDRISTFDISQRRFNQDQALESGLIPTIKIFQSLISRISLWLYLILL
jgi:hypothetical protein